MLTQLATVKSRLALTVTDYDDLLTNAIEAISARFDKECNRSLARSTGAAVLKRGQTIETTMLLNQESIPSLPSVALCEGLGLWAIFNFARLLSY